MWTLVILVLAGILLKFFYDINKQQKSVSLQGGMLFKYMTVIDYIKSGDPRTKIYENSGDSLIIGTTNIGGITIFRLTQTFGSVTIQWEMDSPIYGKNSLDWEFDETFDQSKMVEKIKDDLTKFQFNIINVGNSPVLEKNNSNEEFYNNNPINSTQEEWDWWDQNYQFKSKEQFAYILKHFFFPYKINPTKFAVNHLSMTNPSDYKIYQNDENLSKSLSRFIENNDLKARGYPDWFYYSFPDVALWAVGTSGKEIIKTKLEKYIIEDLIDSETDEFNEFCLKLIIELYIKEGRKLECAGYTSAIDDELYLDDDYDNNEYPTR